MTSTEKENALVAIAHRCLADLRKVDPADLQARIKAINPHAEQAALLGFSRTMLVLNIGYITGQSVDRRQGR